METLKEKVERFRKDFEDGRREILSKGKLKVNFNPKLQSQLLTATIGLQICNELLKDVEEGDN